MLVKSYFNPAGGSLFYPVNISSAQGTIPQAAMNGMMTMANGASMTGAAPHHLTAALAAAQSGAVQQLPPHLTNAAALAAAAAQQQLNHHSAPAMSAGHQTMASMSHQQKISPTPSKKLRPSYIRPSSKNSRYIPKPIPQELGNLKTYSSPDILICGNCREMFNDIVDMIDHKKNYCKLRFTCKCDEFEDGSTASNGLDDRASASGSATAGNDPGPSVKCSPGCPRPKWLHCTSCKTPFSSAWDLMVHVQTAHMMNIYLLADSSKRQQQQPALKASTSDSSSTVQTSSCLSPACSPSSRGASSSPSGIATSPPSTASQPSVIQARAFHYNNNP